MTSPPVLSMQASPVCIITLLPGLAILEAVANRYQCRSFAASPYGVREGYLMYMLEEESRHD